MIVVDVNVLIFAYNEDAPQHQRARLWLERALSGAERIGIPWAVVHGFLRITTNTPAIKPPLPMTEAVTIVEEWFSSPAVTLVEAGPRYWSIFRRLLANANVEGALVSDAHIAALAIENDAAVCTTDRDFRGFAGLRVITIGELIGRPVHCFRPTSVQQKTRASIRAGFREQPQNIYRGIACATRLSYEPQALVTRTQYGVRAFTTGVVN